MNVIAKLGSTNDIFQKAYSDFSNQCFNRCSMRILCKDFSKMQDLYVRSNQVDSFCSKIMELAAQLRSNGQVAISDFLINQVCKLCVTFRMNERAKCLLNIAIENSRQKDDGMHELARLIDLENLYKEERARQDLFRVLKAKKECCTRILENYDEQRCKFDSIFMKPTSKEAILIQLAYTYSDLAYMLERRKPADAIKLYDKTARIYETLGHTKEVRYLQEKIRRIRVRNNL